MLLSYIYGYGSNKTRAYEVDVRDKAINQLLKKISCKSNIKFHGAIYGEDKWSILKQAGALCLFSKSEAMPLILSEAISVGTVVLFSQDTNYTSIIQDNQFFCDGSRYEIAKLLDNYATNMVKNYEPISQGLVDTFHREFSKVKIEEELQQLTHVIFQKT